MKPIMICRYDRCAYNVCMGEHLEHHDHEDLDEVLARYSRPTREVLRALIRMEWIEPDTIRDHSSNVDFAARVSAAVGVSLSAVTINTINGVRNGNSSLLSSQFGMDIVDTILPTMLYVADKSDTAGNTTRGRAIRVGAFALHASAAFVGGGLAAYEMQSDSEASDEALWLSFATGVANAYLYHRERQHSHTHGIESDNDRALRWIIAANVAEAAGGIIGGLSGKFVRGADGVSAIAMSAVVGAAFTYATLQQLTDSGHRLELTDEYYQKLRECPPLRWEVDPRPISLS